MARRGPPSLIRGSVWGVTLDGGTLLLFATLVEYRTPAYPL
jgi:hypothetical protein